MSGVTLSVSVPPAAPVSADPKPAAPAADPNRPAWLPAKFANPEALAASYAELEKKLGTGDPAAAPADPAAPAAAPPVDPVKVDAALVEKGIDLEALSREYVLGDGELSAETLASLKEKGISPDTIAAYVKGQEALNDSLLAKLNESAGSNEAREAIYAWAKANLPKAALAAYDQAMATRDADVIQFAFDGLKARYQAVNGTELPSAVGAQQAITGALPFTTQNEMVAWMSDPRYTSGDPEYHRQTDARLMATPM